MKNSYSIFTIIFMIIIVLSWNIIQAQTPEKISYQAVLRNSSNNLVLNSNVGMKISILKNSSSGTAVYEETQTVTTNANGLATLEIGGGTVISGGNLSAIDWTDGSYFIKTETDVTGGNNYSIAGTSQLLSVPYALYAKTSGSSTPGPQGPTGAQGPQGIAGNNGLSAYQLAVNDGFVGTETQWLASLMGPQGATGPQGLTGDQGPVGATGATGATGPQGPIGATGAQGAAGNDGLSAYQIAVNNGFVGTESQWLSSLVGPQGPQGIQGATGATGATGAQGPQGIQGLTGTQGPIGLTGPTGANGATGPQGPAGTNGTAVLNGNINPTNSIGVNGDFYINTTTNTLFGPKASGAWPTGVSLVGPQGPQGIQGAIGATGPTGAQGPQGIQGLTGPQGPVGATGATGATGPGLATGGTSGQVLAKIDNTNFNTQWITPFSLPSQSGNAGRVLQTNGTTASWQNVSGGTANVFASRTTNIVINSSTFTEVISVNLEANKTYQIEIVILGQRAGATSGACNQRLRYTGSATMDYGLQIGSNYANLTSVNNSTFFDQESINGITNWASTVTNRYGVTGVFKTNTSGALSVEVARGTGNTTIDLNVREGTYILARPIN